MSSPEYWRRVLVPELFRLAGGRRHMKFERGLAKLDVEELEDLHRLIQNAETEAQIQKKRAQTMPWRR